MQPIVFVVCTPCTEEEFKQKPFAKFQQKIDFLKYHFQIFFNNKQGLSTCYNQAIDKWRDQKPLLVFLHDDVCICDLFWEETLRQAMQKAPIVGVAGAAKYDVHAADASQWPQRSPLNQTYHGCVSHPFGDQSIPSVYGGAGLVQVLDGLLLAIDMEHPQASALRFDERFKFHFYDLDLCLQASTAGIPMYAMLMAISHDSHGSYHSPEWTETLSRYYSKWRAPAGNTLIGTLQMSG